MDAEHKELFNLKQVNEGQKFAQHLLKQLTKEDPRTALIALCLCLPVASRACGIRVKATFNMLMAMEGGVENFEKNAAAGADIPGIAVVPG